TFEDIVYIVDVKRGKVLHQIDSFKDFVSFAEFLADGKTLLTRKQGLSVGSCEAVLWDVATGKMRCRFADVSSCACSADRNLLTTGHLEGSIRVFDAAGKEHRHFKAYDVPVFSLALSPDGKLLASGGGDEGELPGPSRERPPREDTSVRLWRTATGEE